MSQKVPLLGDEMLIVIGPYPERRRATIKDLLLFKEAAVNACLMTDVVGEEEYELDVDEL